MKQFLLMKFYHHYLFVITLITISSFSQLQAKIVLPALFSSNMILQQNTNATIWGEAEIGQTIQIITSWNNNTYSITADANGKWRTKIATINADNTPYSIEINDNVGNVITLNNVLMGEVWLCSGQSNMVIPVSSTNNSNIEATDADYPNIRFFRAPENPSIVPMHDLVASWEGTNSISVLTRPAVAFFYARNLYKHLKIPIGIVHAAMGSSTQEAWLSEENIAGFAADQKILSDARNGLLAADFLPQKVPTVLYNGMFKPLVPYTIKGICWYQGEANTANPDDYKILLDRFVKSWRVELEQPELPILIVQLSGYNSANITGWPLTQEIQYKISENTPNIATVMTYDIGDSTNIHPRNKLDVGLRLCMAAMKTVYGVDVIAQGPVMEKLTIAGNKVQVLYKNTGTGIVIKDGTTQINNFMLASTDRVFYSADATLINTQTVEVSSNNVIAPKFIRYAFSCFNPNVNFYNSAGIPAVPFRTDSAFVYKSVKSGDWKDPSTWECGVVPTKDDNVIISKGDTVRYFVSVATSTNLCTNLIVEGTLQASCSSNLVFNTYVFGSVVCNGKIELGQTGSALGMSLIFVKNTASITGKGSVSIRNLQLNADNTDCLIDIPVLNCSRAINVSANTSKFTIQMGTVVTMLTTGVLSVAMIGGQGVGVNSIDVFGTVNCGTVLLCNNATVTNKSAINIKKGGTLNVSTASTPVRASDGLIGGSGLIFSVENGGAFNWTKGSDPMKFTSSSNSIFDPKLEVAYYTGSVINGLLMTSDQKGGSLTAINHAINVVDAAYYSPKDASLRLTKNYTNIKIYNTLGRLVYSQNNPKECISIPHFTKGVYLIYLTDNSGKSVKSKVVV